MRSFTPGLRHGATLSCPLRGLRHWFQATVYRPLCGLRDQLFLEVTAEKDETSWWTFLLPQWGHLISVLSMSEM